MENAGTAHAGMAIMFYAQFTPPMRRNSIVLAM